MSILSQRQHCLRQAQIFSKALLLLQLSTEVKFFLSSVKEAKTASGTTKTQEVFNLIVCNYLLFGCLFLFFKVYLLNLL